MLKTIVFFEVLNSMISEIVAVFYFVKCLICPSHCVGGY